MARGLTTMEEMIYSAVWADFIPMKSLQYVSLDAMVFVYKIAMEMIYSAVWADFILTKSLQYVSSDAMVFVYKI